MLIVLFFVAFAVMFIFESMQAVGHPDQLFRGSSSMKAREDLFGDTMTDR